MNFFRSLWFGSYFFASNWFSGSGALPATGDGQGGITAEMLAALRWRARVVEEDEEEAAVAAALALARRGGWKMRIDHD